MNDYNDPKIARFPTAEERAALEKARMVQQRAEEVHEPILNVPPVVSVLCLLNLAIFLLITFLPEVVSPAFLYDFSFVPARYFTDQPPGFSAVLSPLTHMFIHAGWLHLAMNLGTLLAFGTGIEKRIGGRKMLVLYFASGLCGAILHTVLNLSSESPLVGASGAISGLFGGILMIMYGEGLMGRSYRSLLPFVAVWVGISIFFGMFGVPGTDNPVAWATHVGGFIGGILLFIPISRFKLQRS